MKVSDNRFYAIFQHSHIGIIISNSEGEIEEINPFCSEIFGYEEGELLGQGVDILLPPSLRTGHVVQRKSYLEKPLPRSMGVGRDLKAQRKDGTDFSVEVSLCSYEINGERKIISFINDISDRKEDENKLIEFSAKLETKVEERTKELSQALVELNHSNRVLKAKQTLVREALEKEKDLNEMKSRFVSMASHEFRTPLAGILTSITLIEKYKTEEFAKKKEKHIRTIRRSVKNLTSILNDFLSLDKLDQGITVENLSDFKLEKSITDIVQDISDLSAEDQRIRYEHKGESVSILQDKDMLRNVLINLLSNALKYSPKDKDVFIESEFVGDKVRIKVKDQGMGIPLDEQKHLFKRFFRAKNAINLQGTGLGLNIVKRYIDIMKGTITFDSEEAKGTEFTIEFPRERGYEQDSIDRR